MPRYTIRDPTSGRTVTIEGDSPPTEQELEQIFATVNAQGGPPRVPPSAPPPVPVGEQLQAMSRGNPNVSLKNAASWLPTIGGSVGQMVGGIPGAAIGGAAGAGFQQLAEHAGEIPGAVVDVARNLVTEPKATLTGFAQGAGEGLKDAGIQAGIQGGAAVVGAGVEKGVKAGAKAIYRGYVKPSLAGRMLPKAQQIVDTALDEAIPISKSGQATAQAVIADLRGQVDDVLAQSNESIDLGTVAQRIRAYARQRYYKPGADLSDYQTALAVASKIDEHPSLLLPPPAMPRSLVSLAEGNEIKRAVDTSIGETAFGATSGAKKSTEKFARRALREGLEAKAPEIGPLNARESRLIDAAKAIAHAVEREANQNKLYGVKTLVAGGIGANELRRGEDVPTAIAKGVAARALLSPVTQSNIAILANRLALELGVGASTATRLAARVLSEQEPAEDGP